MSPSPSRGHEFRLLRGLWTDIIDQSYVPNSGEPLWVIDRQELRMGDGVSVGGVQVAPRPVIMLFTDFPAEGIAAELELSADPIEELLVVICNGLDQTQDVDFSVNGRTVTFTYPLYLDDRVKVKFFTYPSV